MRESLKKMYFRLMNVIDVVTFIILTYGFLRGLNKGFVIEISSILAFAFGLMGAFKFSNLGNKIFSNLVDWNPKAIQLVCFITLFLIITYLISLMAKMITKTLKLIALGWLNRIFGALFGFIKWSIITSALFIVVNEINTFVTIFPKSIFENSKVYPFLADFGSFLFDWVTESKVIEENQII